VQRAPMVEVKDRYKTLFIPY